MPFDAEKARQTEAVYQAPEIAATRIAVYRALDPKPGERCLDIGTGPGFFARDLGAAVGETGAVLGLDLSDPMLTLARARCEGLAQVRLERGDAGALPVEDGWADLASVMQVYAYVPDLAAALAEAHRALKPGARFAILDTDFDTLALATEDRPRMRAMIEAYDAHVAWPRLPQTLPRALSDAGFGLERVEAIPLVSTRMQPGGYAHGLVRFIAVYARETGLRSDAEIDAWEAEQEALDREGRFFFSLNRFLFLARRL